MNSLSTTLAGAGALAATLLCLTPAVSAHAAGKPIKPAAISYTCAADGQLVGDVATVTFALDNPPTEAVAGDLLYLQGSLEITLPDSATTLSRLQLATEVGVEASDFSLAVHIGSVTRTVKVSDAIGARQPIASPTKVVASVQLPPIKVPAKSTDVVTLEMPTQAAIAGTVTGAPEKVVFGTQLSQDSLLMPLRYLDCWLPEAPVKAAVVARVPVVAPSTPAPTDPGETSNPGSPALPDTGGGLSAPTTSTGGDVVTPPVGAPSVDETLTAPDDQLAPNAAAPASSGPALAEPVLAAATVQIPPQTVGQGTFVPAWSLALITTAFPATAVTYAVRQRRRLRRLLADGAGTSITTSNAQQKENR